MKRTMKREFEEAMDELHFSQKEKSAMTQRLLNQAQEHPKTFSSRKLVVLSLAAVLILSTMTAAAVYIPWPISIAQNFHFREQDKQAAKASGLAVLPQKTKPIGETISTTDQGVTISVAQTLMDPYRAVILLRVEGVDLPEGLHPRADWEITMSGRDAASMSSDFFNGILETAPGVFTYADGSPLERDESGFPISRYMAADGSLECSVSLTYETPQSSATLVTARCSRISAVNHLGESIPLAEGNWELSWTLTGSAQSRTMEPNAPIGDSGYLLKRAELTSLTALMELSGTDRPPASPSAKKMSSGVPSLEGVMLKDGTYIPISTGTVCSVKPTKQNTLLCNSSIQVVDVNQIASLVFDNQNAERIDGEYVWCDDYIVPIS